MGKTIKKAKTKKKVTKFHKEIKRTKTRRKVKKALQVLDEDVLYDIKIKNYD